jgi:DNA-binding NarL/FixJ family response regulator
MTRLRIVVVDDHTLFRRVLISLLSEMPEFDIVGEASNGQEALQVIAQLKPEMVLLDINMPVMDGVETLRVIRKTDPHMRVVILTISQNDDDLIGAIVAGANGYLLKNTEPEELRTTLLQVEAGNSVISPEVTIKVLDAVRRAQAGRDQDLLSDRELQVLRCMAKGQTTSQIATALFISENTVKTHIRHILEKLGVGNRAQAVATAAEMKLI